MVGVMALVLAMAALSILVHRSRLCKQQAAIERAREELAVLAAAHLEELEERARARANEQTAAAAGTQRLDAQRQAAEQRAQQTQEGAAAANAALEAQLTSKDEEISARDAQLDAAADKLAAVDAAKCSLSQELAIATNDIRSLVHANSQMQAALLVEVDSLEERLVAAAQHVSEAQAVSISDAAKLASKDAEIAAQDSQLAAQQEQLADKDKQLASVHQRMAARQNQLADKDEQLEYQNEYLAALQSELKGQLQAQQKDLAAQHQQLERKNEDLLASREICSRLTADLAVQATCLAKCDSSPSICLLCLDTGFSTVSQGLLLSSAGWLVTGANTHVPCTPSYSVAAAALT